MSRRNWLLASLGLFCMSPATSIACSCLSGGESRLQRIERDFNSAATVAVMRVVGFEGGSSERNPVSTKLQLEYWFKQRAGSQPPYHGLGAYSRSANKRQAISSCDIELEDGQLVVAFADERGLVHFGGCEPSSGPIDFSLLPYFYELQKTGKLEENVR